MRFLTHTVTHTRKRDNGIQSNRKDSPTDRKGHKRLRKQKTLPSQSVGKDEVAMHFNIKIKLPDDPLPADDFPLHAKLFVSEDLLCVPKQHISIIIQETAKPLVNQGFQCFKCAKAHIKLSPLSVNCQGTNHLLGDFHDQIQMDLVVHCGADGTAVHFSLSISPTSTTHYRKSVQSAPGVLTKKQKNVSTVTPATLKRNLASINARFRKALNSHSAYESWDFELNSCCT